MPIVKGLQYDMTIGPRVIAKLSRNGPMTIEELQDAIDDDPQHVRFAVYNLVKRGKAKNLNAGSPRGTPGRFALVGHEPTDDELPADAPRYDATALQQAWFGAAR